MTPTEIETAARNKYNAVGDTFFSRAEILGLMDEACLLLATEADIIEAVDSSTTTVASTQSYDMPTNFIKPKRVLYDGRKLQFITQREDDAITGFQEDTTSEGTPTGWYLWVDKIYLRPIPDDAKTLKIWGFKRQADLAITDTLTVPDLFHRDIVNYCVAEMFAKDQNPSMTQYYNSKWDLGLKKAIAWSKRRRRGDRFAQVQDEDVLGGRIVGVTA
jgi:hypothetical protein